MSGYSGRFVKSVGGYLYLFEYNGKWHFAERPRPVVAAAFEAMRVQGVTPTRCNEPAALKRSIRSYGNTLRAWSIFPPLPSEAIAQ